jgi:hypothetical protein
LRAIATIVGRSGARVAALDHTADYGASYVERSAADRAFSVELTGHHGAPETSRPPQIELTLRQLLASLHGANR